METGEQEKGCKLLFSPNPLYFGGILIFYAGLMLNWQAGHLRFVNPSFNYLLFAAGQLVPFAVFLRLFRVRDREIRTLGFVIVTPVCFVSALLFLFAGLAFLDTAGSSKDASCELQQTVAQVSPPVKVYRTNGGATTSFGILIQQERAVLPGVVWAEPLYYAYPAAEVDVKVIDRHHVRCIFPPYYPDDSAKVVTLKVN